MFYAVVVLVVALIAQSTIAEAEDVWRPLAKTQLPPGVTTITLDTSRARGSFKALRLMAEGGDISGATFEITFANCNTQNQEERIDLNSRQPTQPLSLQSGEQFIDQLRFDFEQPVPRRTTLIVSGLQSETGEAARRPSKPTKGTETTWGGFYLDAPAGTQTLHWCDATGEVDELQLRARGGDVFIKGLRITYSNEQTQLIPIKKSVRAGARTKRYKLTMAYPIRMVQIWYARNTAKRAHVDVYRYPERVAETAPTKGKKKGKRARSKAGKCGTYMVYDRQTRKCMDARQKRGDCVAEDTCTPVAVYFGTNRSGGEDGGRVRFGPNPDPKMSLGRAIVTVPRSHGVGQVERPSYWSAADWWDRLEENAARHFTIPSDGIQVFQSEEQFVQSIRAAFGELADFKDHALIYIHGFNVEFDEALYRLAQFTYDLGIERKGARVPFGLPFLFSWPARGGVQDYVSDMESARGAEPHLKRFLQLVVTQSQAKYVHLIAHSMGNQPVLRALKEIASAATPGVTFRQIIFAAPDVGRADFAEIAQSIGSMSPNITLYASSTDRTMEISRRVHSGQPRAGDVPKGGPLVIEGVDTIDVSNLSTEFFATNHSKYAEDAILLKDIGKILREGLRPPHDRTPSLGRKRIGTLWYWVFPIGSSPFDD